MADMTPNNPFYHAQDFFADVERDVEDIYIPLAQRMLPSPHNSDGEDVPPPTTTVKRKSRKRIVPKEANTSYVMNKVTTRKGLRLVKIEVFDLESDSRILSAQHVVTEHMDEVMDLTENLVRKISKRISDNL